ncbi:MAG: hypothetical protein FWC24_05635 [Treponema sp.]|nr:hypothetical protein [Treponema sp.]
MVQLYFLSIVLNGLAGFLFAFGEVGMNNTAGGNIKISFVGNGFRLVVGILAAITGLLKLLSPMSGIPILGDLLPALAGSIAGFMLIFNFYRENSANVGSDGKIDRFGDLFLQNQKLIGFAMFIVALLHFLFPAALFL